MTETLDEILKIEKQIDDLKSYLSELYDDLNDTISQQVVENLKNNEYNCGTVNIDLGNHKVKYTVPKKIVWDQETLKTIKQSIINSKQNPDVYMTTKYAVSETKYKNWSGEIQKFFEPARTVEQGKPQIKIERKN
jgi:hypothetical protein